MIATNALERFGGVAQGFKITRLCGWGILIFVTRNKTPTRADCVRAEVPADPESTPCETLRIV
jgi:hypothetical protein